MIRKSRNIAALFSETEQPHRAGGEVIEAVGLRFDVHWVPAPLMLAGKERTSIVEYDERRILMSEAIPRAFRSIALTAAREFCEEACPDA